MSVKEVTTMFNSITNISDDIIEEAQVVKTPKQGKKFSMWVKWGNVVAGVGLIMFIAIGLLHQVTDSSSGRPENDSGFNNNSYEGEQQGNNLHVEQSAEADPVDPDNISRPVQDWEIIYNEVDFVDTEAGLALTGVSLTEEELDMVSPDQLLDWMEPSGAAVYYGNTGKLAYVSVIFQSTRWNGKIEVSIRDAGDPIYSDIIVETEDIVSRFDDFEFTASQFVDTDDEIALLWIVFEREGISYRVYANINLSDMESAKTDLYDIMQCYAETETVPDLELFYDARK